ncbi:MAG TPA: HD domain-containing protein [Spirochaetota bacterium]|nr:bifunctional (p)ppGpp synthetase/guanosine-3',5'-bis(diphosphate) 3'-pyrophosphohydrolase [Spirochaetota bacterium]HQO41191.1 HD domain-containing protein [Spirochaetota bacterium]
MWSQELYSEALFVAAHAHKNQTIPGTDLPYIIHCVNVCNEVLNASILHEGTDTDLCVACAMLHDTIEDTDISADLIAEKFGEPVLAGICALTKNRELPESERIADSLKRIKEQPREIWMVKMADRIVNLATPPPHWTKDKIKAYRDEAITIHNSLKDADRKLAARLMKKIELYGAYIL